MVPSLAAARQRKNERNQCPVNDIFMLTIIVKIRSPEHVDPATNQAPFDLGAALERRLCIIQKWASLYSSPWID